MRLQTTHSLRNRLLWVLLVAIMLTAVAQALISYRTARSEADDIFNYHMQQMALALRTGLPTNGATSVDGDANADENFDFVIQVWTADGLSVFQSAARAELPQRAILGFSNVAARGTIYRVFSCSRDHRSSRSPRIWRPGARWLAGWHCAPCSPSPSWHPC